LPEPVDPTTEMRRLTSQEGGGVSDDAVEITSAFWTLWSFRPRPPFAFNGLIFSARSAATSASGGPLDVVSADGSTSQTSMVTLMNR